MAKGLGSMAMFWAASMEKVSRALWPMARINWRQGSRSRPPGSLQREPREASVSVFQTGELGLKPDLAPQLLHPAAQVLHHGEEHIGPHMGLGVIEDLLLGAALDQLLQDPMIPGVVGAGVQLSVGEGPGAALSELHIAPGVQTGRSARIPPPAGGGRRRPGPVPGPKAEDRPPPKPGRQTCPPDQSLPQRAAPRRHGWGGGSHSGRWGRDRPWRRPGGWPGPPGRRR